MNRHTRFINNRVDREEKRYYLSRLYHPVTAEDVRIYFNEVIVFNVDLDDYEFASLAIQWEADRRDLV